MKNYIDFRKATFNKLTKIMEDRITELVLPKNPFGYTAKVGYYNVVPFGVRDYVITVVLPTKDTYTYFKDKFMDKDPDIFEIVNWKDDNVIGYLSVELWVNKDRLEEAQGFIKSLLKELEGK